jgi:hypothetical protein
MKLFANIVLSLIVLLVMVNALQHGNLKTIEMANLLKIEFSGNPMEHVCFPWWPQAEMTNVEQAVNKATHDTAGKVLGDWMIVGDDGSGGTILSYTFNAPNENQITKVEFVRCEGCVDTGGHT